MKRLQSLAIGVALLGAVAGVAHAATATYVCSPTKIAVFSNRLHAECSVTGKDGTTNIFFWAVPTSDAAFANRFLSVVSSAIVSGRQVEMVYTSGDTSGSTFGCGSSDCRRLQYFVLR